MTLVTCSCTMPEHLKTIRPVRNRHQGSPAITAIPPFVRSNTACYGDHAAESTSDKVQNFSPALFLCNFLSPCKESVSKIGQKIARLRVQSDLCHSFLMLLPCATSWQGTHFVTWHVRATIYTNKIKTARAQVADRQTLRHKVPARDECALCTFCTRTETSTSLALLSATLFPLH